MLTSHYDAQRTSANVRETTLTTLNVRPDTFGKLYGVDLDGQIYAQPLLVSGIDLGNGPGEVVYVATMHNSIYAIDAPTGTVLWQTSLGPSVQASDYTCRDIQTEVGILSTPVIDSESQTIYAVAATLEEGVYHYRLHALALTTGAESMDGPAEIAAPGFDPLQAWQRPGLLLSQGMIYVAFGSHCDRQPFNGWVMSYAAQSGLAQTASFLTSAGGTGASIWQSGRGLAADENGRIYAVTGNGDFDGAQNFGETVISFWSNLSVADWFVPDGWSDLNDNDRDLGTSGAALIPRTNYLITGTKDGRLFVLNRDALGNFSPGNTQVQQEFPAVGHFGIFTFAVWPRELDSMVYVQGGNDVIKGFLLARDGFRPDPLTQGLLTTGSPYQGMAISSNGSDPATAILWVSSPDDAVHAYAAMDLTNELWNSYVVPDRDTLGSFAKFASPTVANGRVFVPTAARQLVVYGLLPTP